MAMLVLLAVAGTPRGELTNVMARRGQVRNEWRILRGTPRCPPVLQTGLVSRLRTVRLAPLWGTNMLLWSPIEKHVLRIDVLVAY